MFRREEFSSTGRDYAHKANHVLNWGGPRHIVDVSKSDLELFQEKLLRTGLAPKTVNDIFTVVRVVWADAYSDGLLKANPLDRIKNIERDQDDDSAAPFTRAELALLANAKTTRLQDISMILFDCWAGLSLSELIALDWDDVDLEAGTSTVVGRRATATSLGRVLAMARAMVESKRKRRACLTAWGVS